MTHNVAVVILEIMESLKLQREQRERERDPGIKKFNSVEESMEWSLLNLVRPWAMTTPAWAH